MRTVVLLAATVVLLCAGMVSFAEARSKEQYRGRYQLRLDEGRGLLRSTRAADPASGPKNVSGTPKATQATKKQAPSHSGSPKKLAFGTSYDDALCKFRRSLADISCGLLVIQNSSSANGGCR